MKQGIYEMSNEDYHSERSAISKSGLDLIDKSPAHFKWAQDNRRDSTPAMQKGTLIHTLVLEPDTFGQEFVVMPSDIKQRRGKAWDEFACANQHVKIISSSEFNDAKVIADAVHDNKAAMDILENASRIEHSVFATDFETDILCKCRPDIVSMGQIFDLKTTRNANARSFSYSCRNYRYHVQAAFYLDVCRAAGMDVENFGFIAVDTQDKPYQCTVFRKLDDESVELGRQMYKENLETYKNCLETNEWPGYPEEYDILTIAGCAYDEEFTDE